jgi:hypothetical protein
MRKALLLFFVLTSLSLVTPAQIQAKLQEEDGPPPVLIESAPDQGLLRVFTFPIDISRSSKTVTFYSDDIEVKRADGSSQAEVVQSIGTRLNQVGPKAAYLVRSIFTSFAAKGQEVIMISFQKPDCLAVGIAPRKDKATVNWAPLEEMLVQDVTKRWYLIPLKTKRIVHAGNGIS